MHAWSDGARVRSGRTSPLVVGMANERAALFRMPICQPLGFGQSSKLLMCVPAERASPAPRVPEQGIRTTVIPRRRSVVVVTGLAQLVGVVGDGGDTGCEVGVGGLEVCVGVCEWIDEVGGVVVG